MVRRGREDRGRGGAGREEREGRCQETIAQTTGAQSMCRSVLCVHFERGCRERKDEGKSREAQGHCAWMMEDAGYGVNQADHMCNTFPNAS